MDYAATFTEEKLQEIVRRIVAVADPVKVVLFGSAARGQMGRHSDADFLVVIEPDLDRRRVTGDIYMSMRGVDQPLDFVVFTTEEVEKLKDRPYYVVYPALKEGKVVYERQVA